MWWQSQKSKEKSLILLNKKSMIRQNQCTCENCNIKTHCCPYRNRRALLENNLLKTLQLRYNVLATTKSLGCAYKRTFSRILPQEEWSRTVLSILVLTLVSSVNVLFEPIKELYPLRTCNYEISSQSNIKSGKFKVWFRVSYWEL
jgi:excinuclease ABC subunit C